MSTPMDTTKDGIEPSVEAITAVPLGLADRCCACPATQTQAFVRVLMSLPGGGTTDLMFCCHHYGQHEAALAASPALLSVQDERHRLTER